MSLDQAEATFVRRPQSLGVDLLREPAGTYATPTDFKLQIKLDNHGALWLDLPGRPRDKLIPYKGLQFRFEKFSDVAFEFVREVGKITSIKRTSLAGVYSFRRVQSATRSYPVMVGK